MLQIVEKITVNNFEFFDSRVISRTELEIIKEDS